MIQLNIQYELVKLVELGVDFDELGGFVGVGAGVGLVNARRMMEVMQIVSVNFVMVVTKKYLDLKIIPRVINDSLGQYMKMMMMTWVGELQNLNLY